MADGDGGWQTAESVIRMVLTSAISYRNPLRYSIATPSQD